VEVEERLAEVAGGGGGVAGSGGRSCGRVRARAAEGARARAQAAAVGCAGGSRRRHGRTAASGWEETRDKVDKVGLGQL